MVWRSTDTGGIASLQLTSTRNIKAGQTMRLRLLVEALCCEQLQGDVLSFHSIWDTSYTFLSYMKVLVRTCIGNGANSDI